MYALLIIHGTRRRVDGDDELANDLASVASSALPVNADPLTSV